MGSLKLGLFLSLKRSSARSKIFHIVVLRKRQDVIALALNSDDTNLLVSTSDRNLIVFIDPTLSLKVVDQMLRLCWEAVDLPLIKC